MDIILYYSSGPNVITRVPIRGVREKSEKVADIRTEPRVGSAVRNQAKGCPPTCRSRKKGKEKDSPSRASKRDQPCGSFAFHVVRMTLYF